MLRGSFAAAFVGLALVALGLVACESPTLPLPPPSTPAVTFGPDADHVRLIGTCGGADADAVIVVINTNPTVPADQAVGGAIANGCGAWDATVYAHAGDYLEITQEYGVRTSTPVDVQVLLP